MIPVATPVRRRRNRLAAAGVVAVVACAISLPGRAQSPTASTQPAAVGPIAYYIASCARCHGDLSAAYLGLEHPKTGKTLEDVIDQMATGPAQAPLEAEGLKQQTALHEAMFRKQPFVWIDSSRRDVIAGEVLPGTALSFEGPGPTAVPVVTDNQFTLPKRSGTLVARRGDAVVRTPVK